jgi:predicted phosphodiesterase
MTAKILVVNDIHLTDRPPSSVHEGYVDELFEMLAYIAELETKLGADAVVWAGDVFHHKQPLRSSHKLVLRTIEVAKLYKNLLVIAGNHDLTQDRMDTLFDQQPLGVLLASGAATFLDGWHETLPLFGVSWQQRWHHPDVRMEAFAKWRAGGTTLGNPTIGEEDWVDAERNLTDCLAVTHAPLYPPGQENEFDHIPTKGEDGISAAMGNTGSLAYGHIHEDHGFFESDGVHYANVGALSRGSAHEYNFEREIQVSLWTEGKGFTSIPVPHRPGSEVFKKTEIEESKHEKLSLDAFLSEVGTTTLAISTTESVVNHIKTLGHVDKPVRERAIQVLEDVS